MTDMVLSCLGSATLRLVNSSFIRQGDFEIMSAGNHEYSSRPLHDSRFHDR